MVLPEDLSVEKPQTQEDYGEDLLDKDEAPSSAQEPASFDLGDVPHLRPGVAPESVTTGTQCILSMMAALKSWRINPTVRTLRKDIEKL